MTDPREKLAAVLANHFTEPNGQLLIASDAIIAALPDMIKPLEWNADQPNFRYAVAHGVNYSVSYHREFWIARADCEQLRGPNGSLKMTYIEAEEAAETHHRAVIMAALGLGN